MRIYAKISCSRVLFAHKKKKVSDWPCVSFLSHFISMETYCFIVFENVRVLYSKLCHLKTKDIFSSTFKC